MGAEHRQIGGQGRGSSEGDRGVGANSMSRKEDGLSLPWGGSPFESPNLGTYLLVERMPHAAEGERVFSRRGMMRRLVCLAGCVALGMAFGCLTISGDQYADIPINGGFLIVSAILGLVCILANGAQAYAWIVIYPVLACMNMLFVGALLTYAFRYLSGVMTAAFVASLVLLIGCATLFRSVSDRIRSRAGAWLAVALMVALSSYGLCLLTGGGRLMTLFVCGAVGAAGALAFMQNLWATDYCAADNRDARFEWHMAWLMAFAAFITIAAIARGTEVTINE